MSVARAAESTIAHRILLVDDHPIVRQGLRSFIDGQSDLEVCGEAASAEDALHQAARDRPDLAIVDVSLKSQSGIELTRQIRRSFPDLPVLVMSFHDEALYAQRALKAGARGYIMKEAATSRLDEAIRRILDGRIYLSAEMTERLLEQASGGLDVDESPIERLSDRELEVFEKIGRGLGTRQIAADLELSVKTIESYRANIKQKLHLRDAAELVQQAVIWLQSQN